MTHEQYERFQHDMLARDADAAQDAAYEAHCLDWTRVEMLEASVDGYAVGIWRNDGGTWSDNLIDDCVDYDEHWEDERP
jgi:hypothetical protein